MLLGVKISYKVYFMEKKTLEELEKELSKLPQGYIVAKVINGKK